MSADQWPDAGEAHVVVVHAKCVTIFVEDRDIPKLHEALNRSLNTWENAPHFVRTLCDDLGKSIGEGVPAPMTRPER